MSDGLIINNSIIGVAVKLFADNVKVYLEICNEDDAAKLQKAVYHGQTLYQIWTQSSNTQRSYCDLNNWPYDTTGIVLHYVLWDSLHKV